MLMRLGDAADLLPGAALAGDPATPIDRVHSDSRTLRAGDLFVALRGERFDGHDFLGQAGAAGAAAAIAERGRLPAGLPGLEVDDTLAALQQLARGWRSRFGLPVIAVTGSNGKTTVTQMAAAILRQWHGDAALATRGNFNNHIGLPLTVLRLRPSHRVAAFELGMNHPGEIARLAGIAQPTVALVNNAQREHQEFMDGVDAVARENGAVIEALGDDGTAVFPAGDAHGVVWRAQAGSRRCLTFSVDGAAEVQADARWVGTAAEGLWALALRTPAGNAATVLHMAGHHNVHNALAAAAASLAAGAPLASIVEGLRDFRPVAGRSQVLRWQHGARVVTLVDDSYNANPDSVRAAIAMLAALPGPHWLVLGDMGEVGTQGPEFHAEVGEFARALGIDWVWTVGDASAATAAAIGPRSRHFGSVDELVLALAGAPDCASALVKGSRFMRMERVVAALAPREREVHGAL